MSAEAAPDAPAKGGEARPFLSVYVICQDEAGRIEACMRSVPFAGQIVVVDSGSTDGTQDVLERLRAEGLPIELHHRDWDGYARQKQFALDRCRGEWCLNLDGDEVCAPGFGEQAMTLLRETRASGIRVGLRVALYGYGIPPSRVARSSILRIHRRGHARYDTARLVHEHVRIDGRIAKHPELEIHDMRALPYHEQIAKEARYADLKARQLFAAGKRPRPLKLLFNPGYAMLRALFVRRLALAGWAGWLRARALFVYAHTTEARLIELWREEARNRDGAGEEAAGR